MYAYFLVELSIDYRNKTRQKMWLVVKETKALLLTIEYMDFEQRAKNQVPHYAQQNAVKYTVDSVQPIVFLKE